MLKTNKSQLAACRLRHDVMKQLHIIYHGKVQGVGFRATVDKIARKYPVAGWVRNLPDGTVELTAEGETSILEAFSKSIRTSHLMLFIRKANENWLDASGEWKEFSIKG